ncbi:ABC transporter substrate-binding protein [Candidatus Bathyarchaeota archaeon]|nr:ABC transporter substrate-binding protein [Candidatus Bathyarchaeota archaeon]
MKRLWVIGILVLVSSMLIAASMYDKMDEAPEAPEPRESLNVTKIGVTVPRDGEALTYLVGLAERDINGYADSLGCPTRFEFIVKACGGDPQIAYDNTYKFHDMGVNLIVGHPWSSMLGSQMRKYVAENGMMLMSPSSTSPDWSIPGDNVFRICCTDDAQAVPISQMLGSLNIEYALIFYNSRWTSEKTINRLTSLYGGDGDYDVLPYEPTINLGPPYKNAGYDKVVMRKDYCDYLGEAESLITESGANRTAVVLIGFWETLNILGQALEYPAMSEATWIGSDAAYQLTANWPEDVTEAASTALADLTLLHPYPSPENSSAYRRLSDEYKAATGEELDHRGANYYDGCWIYALAVMETNTTDVEEVKAAVREIAETYRGVSGPCRLNQDDDRRLCNYGIYGYGEDEGELKITRRGIFNATTGEVTWRVK